MSPTVIKGVEPHENDLQEEVVDLERRLAAAKAKLSKAKSLTHQQHVSPILPPLPPPTISTTANHFLLLLSDSALPLGSFAFSSGLESYLAHHKAGSHHHHYSASASAPSPSSSSGRSRSAIPPPSPSFGTFLPLSITSYASTTLPFLLAAHRDPSTRSLLRLDDTLDATIICTVGRRASVAQGRALLSIWERSLADALPAGAPARDGLREFSRVLKSSSSSSSLNGNQAVFRNVVNDDDDDDDDDDPPAVSAHLAPLFGAIGALAGLSLEQTAYVFMLGHVKALVSAAVRAGVFGPYQAQKTLAGAGVQGMIAAAVAREWDTAVERAGQCVPVMDLWFGRHEVLYSRIFNS